MYSNGQDRQLAPPVIFVEDWTKPFVELLRLRHFLDLQFNALPTRLPANVC